MNHVASLRVIAGLALVSLLAGCTAGYYRKSADRAAYRAIQEKTPQVHNMDPNFTIEQTNRLALDGLPVATNVFDYLGPDGERENGARVLNLEAALDIAVKHSRAYQLEKEGLYLDALGLADARHRFTPIFSGRAAGSFSGRTQNATEQVFDEVTGEFKPVLSDNLVERNEINSSAGISADWFIKEVGRLTVSFSTVGSSRVDLQACKLEYSIVSPK